MAQNKTQTETTVGGLRAIEMRYRAVKETDGGETAFYQSQMRLNAPDMGVLLPDRYLPVLECTEKSADLFRLAFMQVIQAVKKFSNRELDFGWVSVYMPLRLLRRPDCVKRINALTEKYNAAHDKICFELSVSLLDEKDSRCADAIHGLRQAGYHTMLTEVGGDSCPMMKLARYNLDYIMLDGAVSELIGKGERAESCVKSMVAFVNEYGAEPIAAEISDGEALETLSDFDCLYFTGEYAGNFVLERYIRRKSDSGGD